MAKLFTHAWYARELKEVDFSIVDLLTGKEPCHIYLHNGINTDPDSIEYGLQSRGLNTPEDMETEEAKVIMNGKVETENLAINYADIHPSIPPLIVDAKKNRGYRVYSRVGEENKIMTGFEWESGGFYDSIKIPTDKNYIWDGTVDELLQEFKKDEFVIKEFVLKDNESRKEFMKYQDIFSEENSD